MRKAFAIALIFAMILSFSTPINQVSAASIKVWWGQSELKPGQIGKITVIKPINLWKRDSNNKLSFVRVLKPGEVYRVYSYDSKHGGQYGLGGGMWITKMPTHIKYQTPTKAKLAEFKNKEQIINDLKSKYIGKIDPQIANSDYLGGYVITENHDNKEYAIEYVKDSGYTVILFEEMLYRNSKGHAIYQVLDAVVQDALNYSIYDPCSGVYKKGKYLASYFAIAKYEDKEHLTKVQYAYYANKETGKFESVPVSGVSCYNIGYDL